MPINFVTLIKVVFRNYKLEDLRFFTEKGPDISVRDTTNNSAAHFPAVVYGFDIIKLLLGERTPDELTKLNDKNPQHISTRCGNLEARKSFAERRAALNNAKKCSFIPLLLDAQSDKL